MHDSPNIVNDDFPLLLLFKKLKLKIWNNEYIDFRPPLGTREDLVSLLISTGIFQLHRVQNVKPPSQLTDAISTLHGSVHIEKYSTEAPPPHIS